MAAYTLVEDQQAYTGGIVGIKNLADLKLLGYTFNAYKFAPHLYYLIAGVLVLCLIGCALLMKSKFGKVLTAIRDNENRVLALGYSTAMYKLFVFALAGMLSGVAGALYVAANGLAGPEYLKIGFSIDIVVWVAVGGRGTLFGAVLGAVLVSFAQTRISESFPNVWPILLGGLFIGSVVLLPQGVVGYLRKVPSLFQNALKRTRRLEN
jgi:urea transport system permease protein